MRSKLSEFIPLMALAAAITLVAAACGGNDDVRTDGETATAAPAAELGAPTRQLSTPATPGNGTVPGEIETAARRMLTGELAADAGAFSLESSESVQWSDASLGCPEEGMMYAQVITPGYKLVFDFDGTSYAVHTNSDGSHVVVCGDG